MPYFLRITKGKYEFGSGKHDDSGSASFITLTEFYDPNKGFLVNDVCTIEAEICVESDGHRHPNDNHIMPLVTRNNNSNLVDFKGLCKSHKDVKDMDDDTYEELQDLWEQLNSFGFDDLTWLKNASFPILVQLVLVVLRDHDRNWVVGSARMVSETSVTDPYKDLDLDPKPIEGSHKDVKDINDDAVKELHNLWEEFKSFEFDDLTWLENNVKIYTK
ncbi:hypothetical protein Ahy_A02g004950 [Arachis hypogaea]|uniref:MATH domain-containing protein n=1 Tax=Arachis hypogaea TaxID=3818 RepID=A0A445E575_ARAHY|nr:hypothetical protein Ahy_A02g004950 [Arachis hypogaea]